MELLDEVKKVFDTEIEELEHVKNSLDQSMVDVVYAINACKGKVVLCGMGKPGHIVRKIAATMSSLGICSYALHPGEAMHGDLGTLSKDDIIIFVSNSGETTEICSILPNIRLIGTPIVAITSRKNSTLAQYADYLIALPEMQEACELSLAPTSSTTAALVIGDAIAVTISKMRKFKKENFALFHPSGALGRKLTTKVSDVMAKGAELPMVKVHTLMPAAIVEMCREGLGAVTIADETGKLCGLITDGNLKRYLNQQLSIYDMYVEDIMTKTPVSIHKDALAVDALKFMEQREKQLSVLPVVDDDYKVVGLVRNHDIIKLGIFI